MCLWRRHAFVSAVGGTISFMFGCLLMFLLILSSYFFILTSNGWNVYLYRSQNFPWMSLNKLSVVQVYYSFGLQLDFKVRYQCLLDSDSQSQISTSSPTASVTAAIFRSLFRLLARVRLWFPPSLRIVLKLNINLYQTDPTSRTIISIRAKSLGSCFLFLCFLSRAPWNQSQTVSADFSSSVVSCTYTLTLNTFGGPAVFGSVQRDLKIKSEAEIR